MRRVRHLSICDYIVTVGQKISQVLTLSNYNIALERTWHRQSRDDFSLQGHVKFNADDMNGVQIVCYLAKGDDLRSFSATEFKVFRVDESSWAETLVTTVTPTHDSPIKASAVINQSTFGVNELSGMETYSVQIRAVRKRRSLYLKLWFNHLGSFDSIWRLKRAVEQHEILKLDE